MLLVWKKLTIGAMRALSGMKARKAPKTHGAPPVPLMADMALQSRARLTGRSRMIVVVMVRPSESGGFASAWVGAADGPHLHRQTLVSAEAPEHAQGKDELVAV